MKTNSDSVVYTAVPIKEGPVNPSTENAKTDTTNPNSAETSNLSTGKQESFVVSEVEDGPDDKAENKAWYSQIHCKTKHTFTIGFMAAFCIIFLFILVPIWLYIIHQRTSIVDNSIVTEMKNISLHDQNIIEKGSISTESALTSILQVENSSMPFSGYFNVSEAGFFNSVLH